MANDTNTGNHAPCPCCGATNLLSNIWYIKDQETDAIECQNCGTGAPLAIWDLRAGALAPKGQLSIYDDWIDGNVALPKPGQRVLHYYLGADGEPVGPLVSTSIHADGSHIYKGKYIYRKTLYWLPTPPDPFNQIT